MCLGILFLTIFQVIKESKWSKIVESCYVIRTINLCSIVRTRKSDGFWICNVLKYVWMLRQVQSLYRHGHVLWINDFRMNEFNIEFYKFTCFASAHEKFLKNFYEGKIEVTTLDVAWNYVGVGRVVTQCALYP